MILKSTYSLADHPLDNASIMEVIQLEPEKSVSHSPNLIEEPSEFERSASSPDSPFESIHLIGSNKHFYFLTIVVLLFNSNI